MKLIPENTRIDFIGVRLPAALFSGLLIVISLVSLLVKGGPNYGIDFEGGTLIQLTFKESADLAKIRATLDTLGLGDYSVQRFGDEKDVLINIERSEEGTGPTAAEQAQEALAAAFGDTYEVDRVEMVGPKVGADLRSKALMAMLYAMIGILIYVTLRFEFRFGVAAVTALAHDAIITIGAFSVTDKEFTLTVLAALLTIIGYSLNDTIVIFDRVREDLKIKRGMALVDVLNLAINQTLSRTILTSGLTLMVVLSLFFLGGEVIHDFAFAMVVGIVIGSYSTVYIASPILLLFEKKKAPKQNAPVGA
ncbi:MAG: protein translocase subunit SecF [Nitrospinae bacterium]|nr:protein translocase subunit SecF [Nitrospinota bacterium]